LVLLEGAQGISLEHVSYWMTEFTLFAVLTTVALPWNTKSMCGLSMSVILPARLIHHKKFLCVDFNQDSGICFKYCVDFLNTLTWQLQNFQHVIKCSKNQWVCYRNIGSSSVYYRICPFQDKTWNIFQLLLVFCPLDNFLHVSPFVSDWWCVYGQSRSGYWSTHWFAWCHAH